MSVFEARDYYKPFMYEWAFKAYDEATENALVAKRGTSTRRCE